MADLDRIRSGPSFVGRARELTEICSGIDGAAAGRGAWFTLAGEPGVGKSRLAQEAAAYARTRGARVLWGRCWEHGGAPPYWPWTQVLRGLARSAEPAQLASWMTTGAAEIAQIAPELRDRIGGVPELPNSMLGLPEQARFRLFESLIGFLQMAADAQPLLIVLDDLHAADPASLLMLLAFSREVRGMRVTAIGTYRALEVKQAPDHAALIAQAEREGAAFPLLGLDEGAIGELVESGWGVSADHALVRRLHEMTEGNPFFLIEVLRQMAAEGRLADEASSPSNRLTLPRGVVELIRSQIQPLADQARDVLDVASVIGREFDLGRLEIACGLPNEALIDCLDRAEALELVQQTGGAARRYNFRHALIRETLYDALPPARRRSLHHAVAEAIRGQGATPEPYAEIAFHYCQSGSPGDVDTAIEYSRAAARVAEKQLAYEEVALHLSNAVEALGVKRTADDAFKAELLCDLGQAQVKAGKIEEARKTCLAAADIARSVDRPDLFAHAVLTPGRILSNSGVIDHALMQQLIEARALLGQSDSPLLAQVLARLGVELYWSDRDQCVALCQQAAEMSQRLGDPRTRIVALWCRWHSLRNPDALEQRLAVTEEVIPLAEQSGERDFALEARFYRIADLLEAGDIVGADAGQREYLTAEAELRDRFKRGLLLRAMRSQMDGRLDEAEALAQQAFAAGQQSGRPLTLNSFLLQRGSLMWERFRLAELEPGQRNFILQNPLIVFARCGWLGSLLQMGRTEEARFEFGRLAEGGFQRVPRDWNWLPSMFVLADVCADLDDKANAEPLYRLLSPYASRHAMVGNVYTYGSVAFELGRLAGVLGRWDEAEAHFETALAANTRVRAAVWLGHTQCELAKTLLRRNESAGPVKAAELIAAARQAADGLGLVRLQRNLDSLEAARALSATPRLIEGVAGLEAGAPTQFDDQVASAISDVRDLSAKAAFEGPVTIMFSDVEDSSSLYEKLGDLRAYEVIRAHNEIFREQISAHRGLEVKALGDSFMVAFSSARRAAVCAIATQRSLAAYSQAHPEQPLKVRIGLHVGEAINESADFFGKSVILAARIAALAEGGQILVSSTFRDLASSAGDIRFESLGEKQLKGLSGAHQIFEVTWSNETGSDTEPSV